MDQNQDKEALIAEYLKLLNRTERDPKKIERFSNMELLRNLADDKIQFMINGMIEQVRLEEDLLSGFNEAKIEEFNKLK